METSEPLMILQVSTGITIPAGSCMHCSQSPHFVLGHVQVAPCDARHTLTTLSRVGRHLEQHAGLIHMYGLEHERRIRNAFGANTKQLPMYRYLRP